MSTNDLKAWLIYPYDYTSNEYIAYTANAVPQVGDTVWLVDRGGYQETVTTPTRTATILALGEGTFDRRAIYVSGCAAGVHYERHTWYDRNGSFSS